MFVANTLELIIVMPWRSFSIRYISLAAYSTAKGLFEDAEAAERLDSFSQSQEIGIVGALVEILPQIIKFYSMSEIPGTKVCVFLFFNSLLIVESFLYV